MKYQVGLYTKNNLKYDFSFYHNVSILDDHSSTGKSTFVKAVLESKRAIGKSNSIQIFGDLDLEVVSEKDFRTGYVNRDDTLYIIEEGVVKEVDSKVSSFITDTDLKFLIVSRRSDFRNIPLDIDAIYTVKSYKSKGLIINKNVKKYENIYAKLDKDFDTIVEDSMSGFQFFSKIFKSCKSTFGNGNVVKFLKDKLNIIVDTVCYGSYISELLQEIEVNDLSGTRIADIKSFEYLLLKYLIYNSSEEELQELSYNWNFELYKSLERLYFSELKKAIAYSKSDINKVENIHVAIKLFIKEYVDSRKSLSSSLQD